MRMRTEPESFLVEKKTAAEDGEGDVRPFDGDYVSDRNVGIAIICATLAVPSSVPMITGTRFG